jgi:hypothetical protein
MKYGWIITKDRLFEDGGFDQSDVGVVGPSNIHPELEARLNKGEGIRFRMKDDDGEVYYEGKIVFSEPVEVTRYIPRDGIQFSRVPITDSVPEEGFGPLNDFGMPNAGCTTIEFWAHGLRGGWLGL